MALAPTLATLPGIAYWRNGRAGCRLWVDPDCARTGPACILFYDWPDLCMRWHRQYTWCSDRGSTSEAFQFWAVDDRLNVDLGFDVVTLRNCAKPFYAGCRNSP